MLWVSEETAACGGVREPSESQRSKHQAGRRKDVSGTARGRAKQSEKRITRCGAVGSAPALGAGCRRFESCHLDQKSAENEVFDPLSADFLLVIGALPPFRRIFLRRKVLRADRHYVLPSLINQNQLWFVFCK